jgi:hypothetical protein
VKAWRALLASLLTAGLLLSPPARAKPASWHLWQSMLTGKRICAQTSPGKGWTRLGGPFRDAGCRQATTGSPAGSNSFDRGLMITGVSVVWRVEVEFILISSV